jgi:hypothetical protein
MADDRAALRGGHQRRFGGDAVLGVAEVVGDRAQRLQEHHPEVGL